MKKSLKIKIYSNNNLIKEENNIGILKNNILTFKDNNDLFIINIDKKEFKKKNNESDLVINNICLLTLKEYNKTLEIPIIFYNFRFVNNRVTISYKLESNEDNLKIIINIGDEINE